MVDGGWTRKTRWRAWWRRVGVGLGMSLAPVAVYVLTVAAIVGGWLVLPFRLLQAALLCLPPVVLVPVAAAAGAARLLGGAAGAAAVDAVLPCGGMRWRPGRMRGRGLVTEEVADNICVGAHAVATVAVLLGGLHTAWFGVPDAPASGAIFSGVTAATAAVLVVHASRQFAWMDALQQQQQSVAAGGPLASNAPGSDATGGDGSHPPAGLRRRHTAPPLPPATTAPAPGDRAAATPEGVVFSTTTLALQSMLLYAAASVALVATYAALGGEVAKFYEVLREVSVADVRDALAYAMAGGDRGIIRHT